MPLNRTRLVAATLVALATMGAPRGDWTLPPRWNPWAPLQLADPPNLLTRFKLAQLRGDAPRCLAVLQGSGFRYQPVPDRQPAPGCAFENAVRVERTLVPLSSPFTLACPAAVSLALWQRHWLLPEAARRFGQPVAELQHLGSYACRDIAGRAEATRSEHATANAVDLSALVLGNGRRISVARDWHADDEPGRLLHALRDGACDVFNGVLSPDYNAAHADHLHLDLGRYRLCR